MTDYNAGEAFLQIVPSFRGVADKIEREAAQWGARAGETFSRSFNERVRRDTNNAPLGPSPDQSRRQGQQSGRTFADSFKARVEAALRSLPDITVGADTSAADRRLAELRARLQELSTKRVGVDIDAATAMAEVNKIKGELDRLGRKSSDASVQVNTARAQAALATIQAELDRINGETANADVNVDDHGSASSTRGEVSKLATALIALAPLAAPVGAALAAGLAGVLATIGAVVSGIAVLALGFGGVGDAVKLLDQREQQQATTAKQTANASAAAAQRQANAANQIRSAEQGLADARRNAAHQAITSAEQVANARQSLRDAERRAAQDEIAADRQVAESKQNLADTVQRAADQRRQADEQVASAEYQYRQAVQAVTDAEQALHDAREQAKRDLEDYANRQKDASLSQQQAVIDVQNAQANYTAVMASSTATDAQKAQALLDLQKAQQALVEANQSLRNATEDNTKAQKAGVDGSSAVVNATRQVASAKHDQQAAAQQLADAERAQAEAMRQAAQDIAHAEQQLADARHSRAQQRRADAEQVSKAEQGLRDAIRQQSWQQQQSAEQIKRAQQQVATAMRDVAYASAQAGTAGSTALAGIDYQLAKLSPATLAFARYWKRVWRPIVDSIKGVASANLLPGVRKGLQALRPVIPEIKRFVGAVSGVLGDMAAQLGKSLASPFWQHFLRFMTRNVGPMLKTLGKIVGNVAKGVAGLAEAFQPIVKLIGKGLLALSRQFASFGAGAKHNAGFQAFLDYIRQNAPAVVDAIKNIAVIIGHLLQGLAPLGSVMLKAIDWISQFLAKLSPDQLLLIAGGIAAVWAALGGPVTAIVAAVVAAAALIVKHWSQIKPALLPVIDFFTSVWRFIRDKLVPVLEGIFKKAWEGIQDAIHTVSKAISDHKQQLEAIVNVFKTVVSFIVQHVLPIVGTVLKAAWQATGHVIAWVIDIVAGLVDGIRALVHAAQDVGHWFSHDFVDFFVNAWDAITSTFSDAWTWVKNTWSKLWNGAKSLVLTPIHAAHDAISTVWSNIRGFFSNAWTWVKNTWSSLWNGAKSLVLTPIHDAKDAISTVWSNIRGFFSDAWTWVKSTFSTIWNGITSVLTAPIHAAKSAIHDIWGGIKQGARLFMHGLKDIWEGLKKIFMAPIAWVIRFVINDALIWAWDKITGWIPGVGDSLHIDPLDVPKYATGGIYPGYTPGRDIGLIGVSGGESIMRPEWTRAVGSDYVHAANAAARAGGEEGVRRFLGGFSQGGTVPPLTPAERRKDIAYILAHGTTANPLEPVTRASLVGLSDAELAARYSTLRSAMDPNRSSASISELNPLHWAGWLWHKVTGGISSFQDKFGHSAIGRIIEQVPLGIGRAMVDYVKQQAKAVAASIRDIAAVPTLGGLGQYTGGGGGSLPTGQDRSPGAAQGYAFGLLGKMEGGAYPDPAEFRALVSLWNGESGWRWDATNPDSGAYGIPQALPPEKMAAAGADWQTNPFTQIRWGLNYIRERYGDPINAYSTWLSRDPHWYDAGGLLPPGLSMVYNGTGKPEPVLTSQQWDAVNTAGGAGHFEGNLYLDSGEFLGRVRGETNHVIDKRVGGAQHAARSGVPGGTLGALNSPHARAVAGAR